MGIIISGLPHFAYIVRNELKKQGVKTYFISLRTRKDVLVLLFCALFVKNIYFIWGDIFSNMIKSFLWLGKKVILHWVGSDILLAEKYVKTGNYPIDCIRKCIHWAEVDWTAKELCEIGINAEVVPLLGVKNQSPIYPLPKEFKFITYFTKESQEFYGGDEIYKLAKEVPFVEIYVIGTKSGEYLHALPNNIKFLGWVDNPLEVIKEVIGYIRLTKHDGLSHLVLQTLSMGRYVLWTYHFDGCLFVKNYKDLKLHILELYEKFREQKLAINYNGINLIKEKYSSDLVYKNLVNKIKSHIGK